MSTRPRTVVILQARIGSSRLPGKVLMDLGGKPIILHCIDRASQIEGIDGVCVATTDRSADDRIAETVALRPDIHLFRGSEQDVLDRFARAAATTDAEIVMRLTCDCPLIDPAVCGALLQLRAETDSIYASNVEAREWPHGLDCEVFLRDVLDNAAKAATDPYDREHVTPWIRRYAGTRITHLPGPGGDAAQQRWTVDYPEDIDFLRTLWPLMSDRNGVLDWRVVMDVVRNHPELHEINAARSLSRSPT